MRTKPPSSPILWHRSGAPIAWWSCWEGAGTQTSEIACNAGTMVGGGGVSSNFPAWIASAFGQALSLDGTHWSNSGLNLLAGRTQATIALLFRTPASFPASVINARFFSNVYNIVGWQTSESAGVPVASWAVQNGAGNTICRGTTQLSTSTDYSVICSFDGSQATNNGRAIIYLNGEAESMHYDATVPASLSNNSGSIGFGKDPTAVVSGSYPQGIGLIHDCQVFDYPLTALQAARLADDHWWRLRRPTGGVIASLIKRNIVVTATDTVHFSELIQANADHVVSAADTVHFTDAAILYQYLGRFRRGDVIPLSITTSGLPGAAPTLVVSDDPTNTTIATYQIPWKSGDTFAVNLRLSGAIGNLALGTFRLTANYSIGGVAGSQVFKFDLVDGGDSGGEVIALYVFERPEQRYVVAQLASGQLVQGKNPHL